MAVPTPSAASPVAAALAPASSAPKGGHYPAIVGEIDAIHCNSLRQLRFELARLAT